LSQNTQYVNRKDLIKYGLNEREALVYISLLKLSDSTAFLIAKDVDLPRTTVYETLEDLKRKGLLSVWKKNNVNYYSPESPNILLKQHKEKEELLNSVVPELFSYIKMNGKVPSAKFYTGKEGVKIVLDYVIENQSTKSLILSIHY
jgi:sugar-specific transcriptional regulator TrmB